MCGIAGIMTIDGRPPTEAALDAMTEALRHRGPDGQGRYVRDNVGLIHTRLAIIDINGGEQPFTEPEGCVLVGNGEIYNFVELREEMKDVAFASASDCEPPLYLYKRLGLEFAERLRGMYALALYDPAESMLVLARDPFGIKPLYYAETERAFVFASEPQALIASGLVASAEAENDRNEMLQLQFSTGRGTPFKGVLRVLPGETLTVKSGRVVHASRRPALPPQPPRPMTTEDALQQLDDILQDSVTLHQRSDVPYGMFLSGGVDSSALLAMMKRLNERPVLAFTAGFPGTRARDERNHARAVAHAAGAEHIEVTFTQEDFWALLPRVTEAVDDPAADYAILPTYKLAAEAHKSVKVVLSGEGADELFGGYGRYRYAQRSWPLRKKMRRSGTFEGLGVLRDRGKDWRKGFARSEKTAEQDGLTPLQVVQAIDTADWLPNDLLVKLDRCLMAHGLEGRVPFLDPKVADFAYRLPDELKVQGKLGKWLLRKWLEDALPEAMPFMPKQGFTVPVGEWIGAEGARVGELVARQEGVREVCNSKKIVPLFQSAEGNKKAGFAAWTLLFYALWHERHILGRKTEGGVFDVLGS